METTGACICGAIEYQAEIDPQRIGLCHCRDCQIQSGGAFRVAALVPPASFAVTRGSPKVYSKIAESGRVRSSASAEPVVPDKPRGRAAPSRWMPKSQCELRRPRTLGRFVQHSRSCVRRERRGYQRSNPPPRWTASPEGCAGPAPERACSSWVTAPAL